ncbi:MAG: ribonuclease P protein component [Cyclobacteriaceae bacterium]|jgi:ribonuclease P protein component
MDAPVFSHTFSKKERLTNKKYIEELFREGSFFRSGPFLIRFLPKSDLACHQVLISVPKKYFKRAVKRNRIRRRIREIYRLHKHLLANSEPILLGIIYLSKEELSFVLMKSKLIRGLDRLKDQK